MEVLLHFGDATQVCETERECPICDVRHFEKIDNVLVEVTERLYLSGEQDAQGRRIYRSRMN